MRNLIFAGPGVASREEGAVSETQGNPPVSDQPGQIFEMDGTALQQFSAFLLLVRFGYYHIIN